MLNLSNIFEGRIEIYLLLHKIMKLSRLRIYIKRFGSYFH